MPFKTFVAGEKLTASDVNTYLGKQSIATFSSASARNSAITSPTEGQLAYISSSDSFTYHDGSGWQNLMFGGNWIAHTPTTTGITAGNGTFDCAYAVLGKTVFYRGSFTLGSTSAITTNVSFNLPVTGANSNKQSGSASFLGSTFYDGVCFMTGPTYVNFYAMNSSATYASYTAISSTIPFTWANTHTLNFMITYQAA